MNLSQAAGGLAVVAFANTFGNAVLTIYNGTMPASPETALSGTTALAQFTFSPTAFPGVPTFSGGYDYLTASFVSSTVANPSASATANFARATIGAGAWSATHAYARGSTVINGPNLYVCIVGGTSGSTGPTSTTYAIADGSVYWDYIGPSSANVLADFTVGTSGSDVNLSSTAIQTTVACTINSFRLQVAAL